MVVVVVGGCWWPEIGFPAFPRFSGAPAQTASLARAVVWSRAEAPGTWEMFAMVLYNLLMKSTAAPLCYQTGLRKHNRRQICRSVSASQRVVFITITKKKN